MLLQWVKQSKNIHFSKREHHDLFPEGEFETPSLRGKGGRTLLTLRI